MSTPLDKARMDVAVAVRKARDTGKVRCLGAGCWGCCRGTVEVRPDEVERIATVVSPEAWDRVLAPFEGDPEFRICPLLDPTTKVCSVYAERPLICRGFLSTEDPAKCYPEYVGSHVMVGHPMDPLMAAADLVGEYGYPALDLITALQNTPTPRTP